MFMQHIPTVRGHRRALVAALLLAIGAPLAAHASGTTCKITPPPGTPPTTDGTTALACGDGAKANGGSGATAVGPDAQAGSTEGSETHGQNALAIGDTAVAAGDEDIAVGAESHAEGLDTPSNSKNWLNTAIGYESDASGGDSIAIGAGASTAAPVAGSPDSGMYSVALGAGASTTAVRTVAVGWENYGDNAAGTDAVVIGTGDSHANGESSIVFGSRSAADGKAALSFQSSGVKNDAIGLDTTAADTFSIAMFGVAHTDSSIALGDQSGTGTRGYYVIRIGSHAGTGGDVDATDSVGVGFESRSGNINSTMIGDTTNADGGAGGTVAGHGAYTSAADASALGYDSGAQKEGDLAIGDGATAITGLALGVSARATDGGIAIGNDATGSNCGGCMTSAGTGTVALGASTNSENLDHVTLLGSGAGASVQGTLHSTALGAGSDIERNHVVAVGTSDTLRQITHVAKASADTDAINVGQMDAAIASAGGGGGGGGIDETKAKKYVDAGDAATLKSANHYTDTQVGKMAADDSVVLTAVRKHADASDATTLKAANAHADAGDKATLTSAKVHADAGDAANHAYAGDQLKQALATAKHYEQANDKVTLDSAEAYADARISAISGIDFGKYQVRVNRQFTRQSRKLERTGAVDAALAGMTASAAASARRTRLGVAVGGYHGETAAALGIQHVFGRRVAMTIGAGLAGGGQHSVNLGIGISL